MQKLQELWVWSLGREDPLNKEMATHSSILAWRSPWIEDLGRLQSMGLQRVRHDLATNTINYKIAALVFLQLQIYCKSWSLSLKAPHLQGDLFLEPFLEVLFNWMLYFPEDLFPCMSLWPEIGHMSLWCWRRLLRVPWTARRSNQSILKEISPEYSLEGLMLTLKLQYFGHLMRRADSFEKTLMLGKIEGGRRRGWQRIR